MSENKENKRPKKTNSGKAADVNKKPSVKEQMSARRGPGDSTKADSGGGDSDKTVVTRDINTAQ